MHRGALIELALILLIISLVVNAIARLLVWRTSRMMGGTGRV